jgi:hypothetical protein
MRYLSINHSNFFLLIILLLVLFFVQYKKPRSSDDQYKQFYRFGSDLKKDKKIQPVAITGHRTDSDNLPNDLMLKSSNNEFENNFRDMIKLQLNEDLAENERYDNQHYIENNKLVKSFAKKNISNRNNLCAEIPRGLLGHFEIQEPPNTFKSFSSKVTGNYSFLNGLQSGGSWRPKNCQARDRIAIVLPYRNREDNLNWWLYNMHPFLQRQELDYSVFVVEQMFHEKFNKGILMNAAFKLIFDRNITNSPKYDCIFYHDVDMIPTGF